MKRLLVGAVIFGLACYGRPVASSTAAAAAPQCSVAGDLRILPFTSRIFKNTRMLRVWLPPQYDSPDHRADRYPVLYLNDGQNLFDVCTSMFSAQEWRVDETAGDLVARGVIRPLIIVGIDNAGRQGRAREYLPYSDETLQPRVDRVYGKYYPDFLVHEVMPFINAHFRVDPDPADTGLGGSSYGAGIALYTVMKERGRFGRLLLESPSLYAHHDFLLRVAARCRRWPERIYLGVGTVNEPAGDVDKLEGILRHNGVTGSRLDVVHQSGVAHNEAAWAQRFPAALQFLYGR